MIDLDAIREQRDKHILRVAGNLNHVVRKLEIEGSGPLTVGEVAMASTAVSELRIAAENINALLAEVERLRAELSAREEEVSVMADEIARTGE